MIPFDEAVRLVRIQERLRNATWHEISKDGHHKSSEGAVTLSFVLPPVVGDDEPPYWTVNLWSYLLCPEGRHKTFSGRTASEAISKAEDAAKEWCMSSEMEQFHKAVGGDPDEDFEHGHPSPDDESHIPI